MMSLPRALMVSGVVFGFAACSGEPGERAERVPLPEGAVEVSLSSQSPDEEIGRGMKWSPYGQQLPLTEVDGEMYAQLSLGPDGTPPIALRLAKGPEGVHFDQLSVDLNRDGEFDETELFQTDVSEQNFKFWSSFDAVVGVPVVDPETEAEAINPYPLSLWFVEDPRVQDQEPVIRFSRRGWMEGTVVLDGVEAVVLVTERVMDGVFGVEDSWALASRDSAADVMTSAYSKDLDGHSWLFEKAYHVTEIDPSGRRVVLAPFEPGITRAEEMEMNDHLKVDREAARSGRAVAFLHDFSEAQTMAMEEGKPLLIDFETTWCGPCKIMDEWVYTADDVVAAAEYVVAVKVDGDERLDLKERFGVTGFPTMILLSPGGEEVDRASGYVNVADMTEFLKAAG